MRFHAPWPCSQCIDNFVTENALRQHLSSVHNLVHCRLCHFRVSDDDQYNTHLYQKHNVSNVSSKYDDAFWELEYEGCAKFLCLLCSKSSNLSRMFFNHYMGFHHFTLKCFTNMISGADTPFLVYGADVSSEFVESQLKVQARHGYIDLVKQTMPNIQIVTNTTIEVKEEVFSESEDTQYNGLGNNGKTKELGKYESNENDDTNENEDDEIIKSYKGDEDFDVTLMEIIVFHKGYLEYVNSIMDDINSSLMPKSSYVNYEKFPADVATDIYCSLCKSKHTTTNEYSHHMTKMHFVKCLPSFSCRVCSLTFDSLNELDNHISQELNEFDDLWLCQFCDKEFMNREVSRLHLSEHWDLIEYDNCFSPHLGFKCKYCPTLFWNEPDRESHQVRIHFSKYKDEYYKCESCDEFYSDKVCI